MSQEGMIIAAGLFGFVLALLLVLIALILAGGEDQEDER